jgi:hypothetical protein
VEAPSRGGHATVFSVKSAAEQSAKTSEAEVKKLHEATVRLTTIGAKLSQSVDFR